MRPVRLLWGAVLVAGLVTAPAVALPVAPAQATPNTIVVSSESARSSSSTKTQPLECPATHPFVYGPGASINLISGTAGSVAVESVVPIGAQPRSIEVTAVELGTFTGTWSVIAWAVCGSFTADMQVIPDSSAQNSTELSKEADPECRTDLGDALYGVGFRVTGGARNVLVHDVIPGTAATPRGVTVRATVRPGTTPNWKLEAFAICANASPTMRIVQAATVPNSNSSNGVSRICPSVGGVQLLAHGYGIQTRGDGADVDGRIALVTTAPLSTLSAGAGAVENGAVAQSWQVIVYVICSN